MLADADGFVKKSRYDDPPVRGTNPRYRRDNGIRTISAGTAYQNSSGRVYLRTALRITLSSPGVYTRTSSGPMQHALIPSRPRSNGWSHNSAGSVSPLEIRARTSSDYERSVPSFFSCLNSSPVPAYSNIPYMRAGSVFSARGGNLCLRSLAYLLISLSACLTAIKRPRDA